MCVSYAFVITIVKDLKVASMLCYVAEIVPKSTLFKVTYNGGLWESRTWEHSVPVLVRIPVLAVCNLIPV